MTQVPNPLLLRKAVRLALLEDLGRAGDITTLSTIPADANSVARLVARETGVVCGLDFVAEAFRQLDSRVFVKTEIADCDPIESGATIAVVSGPSRAILSAERVALNYLGRLSGIASLTARYVREVSHTKAHITDTRKTTPGLRAFEKYAVRCGGGMNHRFGLDDAVLIKDNHIVAAGGIAQALRAAKEAAGHLVKIDIEVDTLEQLDIVIEEGSDMVLLDNMTPEQLREAVRRIAGKMPCEASGGVTLATVKMIAEAGVDLISVGALTHSSGVLDIGLDFS